MRKQQTSRRLTTEWKVGDRMRFMREDYSYEDGTETTWLTVYALQVNVSNHGEVSTEYALRHEGTTKILVVPEDFLLLLENSDEGYELRS